MRELPPGVREGEVFEGKYRIGKVLDSGAMGTVVAAHHLSLDQKVAIKFLRSDALPFAGRVERLVREARATARIRSEHVVRVLDVHDGEAGIPYIVMEHLEGRDLAAWLRELGPLPVAQAVEFVLEACEALAEAHDLGIIHRDLKPANLFAVQPPAGAPYLKVLDFGISKTLAPPTLLPGEIDTGVGLTEDRAMMGSLHYMSPEQMESARDVDGRTDIWALGIILCELVTGKPPFEGQSVPQVYFNIVSRPLERVTSSLPLQPALKRIILKCLEPARDKRYRSVSELAADLGGLRSTAGLELANPAAVAPRGPAAQSGDTLRATAPSPLFGLAEKTLVSSFSAVAGPAESPRRRRVAGRVALAAAIAASLGIACATLLVRSKPVVSVPVGPSRPPMARVEEPPPAVVPPQRAAPAPSGEPAPGGSFRSGATADDAARRLVTPLKPPALALSPGAARSKVDVPAASAAPSASSSSATVRAPVSSAPTASQDDVQTLLRQRE